MNKKIRKGEYLDILLKSKKTIFSTKDVALLWGEKSRAAARVRLSYYSEKGGLFRVIRGFYAKGKNYNKYELATKIYTPSYISFETVLGNTGISFQSYGQVFIASYLTREIIIDKQKYSFKKLKDSILTNNLGVEQKDNYSIATPERAFLDTVYLNKDYYFDNFSSLNWDKVFTVLPIYENKRMEKDVKDYKKLYDTQRNNS